MTLWFSTPQWKSPVSSQNRNPISVLDLNGTLTLYELSTEQRRGGKNLTAYLLHLCTTSWHIFIVVSSRLRHHAPPRAFISISPVDADSSSSSSSHWLSCHVLWECLKQTRWRKKQAGNTDNVSVSDSENFNRARGGFTRSNSCCLKVKARRKFAEVTFFPQVFFSVFPLFHLIWLYDVMTWRTHSCCRFEVGQVFQVRLVWLIVFRSAAE